jgi:hypothetical protein
VAERMVNEEMDLSDGGVCEIVYPVVYIEDDGWLEIVTSSDELLNGVEVDYLDEIMYVFDMNGREILLDSDNGEIIVRLGGYIDVPKVSSVVNNFFRKQKVYSGPAVVVDASSYARTAVASYLKLKRRQKWRPWRRGSG